MGRRQATWVLALVSHMQIRALFQFELSLSLKGETIYAIRVTLFASTRSTHLQLLGLEV